MYGKGKVREFKTTPIMSKKGQKTIKAGFRTGGNGAALPPGKTDLPLNEKEATTY